MPSLHQTDLIVRGAQHLQLDRIYISPHIPSVLHHETKHIGKWDKIFLYQHLSNHYKGWQFYPHRYLRINPGTGIIRLSDPHGMTFDFKVLGTNTQLVSNLCGLSNTAGEMPSGKYDPRNTQISVEKDQVIVMFPDGTHRFYRNYHLSHCFCYLEKEILPNGKIIKYRYSSSQQLIYVESMSADEKFVYAGIHLKGNPWSRKCEFNSSSGDNVSYTYEREHFHVKIKNKIELDVNCPPVLTEVSSPFYKPEKLFYSDQFLLNHVLGKNNDFKCDYAIFLGERRTSKLYFPEKDTFQPTCNIHYGQGITTVKNHDGTQTIYRYNSKYLLAAIETHDVDGTLQLQKQFSWTDNQWLESVALLDGQNQLFHKKSYKYDSYGNPTLETFSGNLSGTGAIEHHSIKRAYSQDGRHLLLREEDENGKIITYEYLPDTNLITVKITRDHTQTYLQERFIYNKQHNLIKTIVDDGNIKITEYFLKQDPPFLHMPEKIEEKYVEDGIEKLLRRTFLSRDQWGNVSQQDFYDSQGEFLYSIYKTYDEKGVLLSETNPLKQKATYTYDEKGRLTQTTNFSGRLKKSISYGARDNVVYEQIQGDDDEIKEFFYIYDLDDHLIEKTDEYGNTTYFEYDPISHQITHTEFLGVITSSTYDALGRRLTHTDANGNLTSYKYNAYGELSEILYPNGSKETFRYYKNGKLKSHTNQDELKICYQYDTLGRLLSKTYESDQKIAQETFSYNRSHLLSETDKEGHITQYTYDCVGRKIQVDAHGHITQYHYDTQGRVDTITKWNGDDSLQIHYERDLLDRTTCEYKTDLDGNLLYKISFSYDVDGNKHEIIRYIENEPCIETFKYDSFGQLIIHEDPHGYLTNTFYENHLNELRQKVLLKRSVDPNFITTVQIYDPYGNVIKQEKASALKEFCYDPSGNLILEKDHVGQTVQEIRYQYNCMNYLESYTRAYGTPHARTTSYTFTPSGNIASKTHPNQTTLTYGYHPLGYLTTLTSSDGTIDYHFQRNRLGYLLHASNHTEQITINRDIDTFGNVLLERFSTGFFIEKTYDSFNRPTSIKLDDQGEIYYTYNPLHLKSINRNSPLNTYTHHYTEYDLHGYLQAEQMIYSTGKIKHRRDQKGRQTDLLTPFFSQANSYDPCDNLTHSVENNTHFAYTYDDLSQLTSEKGHTYEYDANYNRIQKDTDPAHFNELNELESSDHIICKYDANGNLIQKNTTYFTYDALNQLIEVKTDNHQIQFFYDPLGRRLFKSVQGSENYKEYYLWNDQEEIGAFTQDKAPKNLKIQGLETPIAIELSTKPYIPIVDISQNIRGLIDPATKTLCDSYSYTAFGEELNPITELFSPWRYASKRWDPETNLSYFGKRYYDAQLARWLTTDPAGFVDGTNLYQFLYNNPFKYTDPDGQFVFTIPFVYLTLETLAPILIKVAITAGTAYIAYEGSKLIENLNTKSHSSNYDYAPIGDSFILYPNAIDFENDLISKKKKDESKDVEKPPYDGKELGEDPTVKPGEDFEWKGNGPPESGEGNWVKGKGNTKETLYPDLNHPKPIEPHWDYYGPKFPKGARLYLDGTWAPK